MNDTCNYWTYLCLNRLNLVVARRQHDTIGTAVAYMNLGELVCILLRDAAVRGVLEPLAAKPAETTGRAVLQNAQLLSRMKWSSI